MKFKILKSTGKLPVFTQCSYLQILLVSVFTLFGAFRIHAKCALCFLLCSVWFVSGPAHILRLTVASGWNKNGAFPTYGHCYVTKLSVVFQVHTVTTPGLDV
jgi:hypothetical protein